MINKILKAIRNFFAVYGMLLTSYCLLYLDSVSFPRLMLRSVIVALVIVLSSEFSNWLKKRRKDSNDFDDYITI